MILGIQYCIRAKFFFVLTEFAFLKIILSFLNGPFPASFLFSSFQYTVDSKQIFNI